MSARITLMLRAIAVLIAAAAVIDPALTTSRRTRPLVAVFATHRADSADAARVHAQLAKRYDVIDAPFEGAAASVVVSRDVPADGPLAHPPFVVTPAAHPVEIRGVRVPPRIPLAARARVTATVHTTGPKGRSTAIELSANGLVLDRVTRTPSSDDETISVDLSFVPSAAGLTALRVSVNPSEGGPAADVATDVVDARWAALFFDRRPSWMSTFVRRSLEADARFVVTSRVAASRGVNTDAGKPPGALDDASLLELYDVIVIGAPDALSDRDVAGLESYLRRRGGTVVLLADASTSGPFTRLAGAPQWSVEALAEPVASDALEGDSAGFQLSESTWPTALPAGATPLTRTRGHPVVWTTPAGAGRVIVSGALDAWRFRDAAFDAYWRRVISEAAASSPTSFDVRVASPIVAAGDVIDLSVTSRGATLAGAGARLSAEATLDGRPVDLSAARDAGELLGRVRAPTKPGDYRLETIVDGSRVVTPVRVVSDFNPPAPRDSAAVAAWATGLGGGVISMNDLDRLPDAIESVIHTESRPDSWHPMRSAWWIVPFVLFLGAEWYSRRRRGLA